MYVEALRFNVSVRRYDSNTPEESHFNLDKKTSDEEIYTCIWNDGQI